MNVKEIATGNAIRAIVEYMQTIAAPDNYQLTKIMCMFSKDILRITVSHSDCLLVAGKKIIFEKFYLMRHRGYLGQRTKLIIRNMAYKYGE